MTYGEYSIVVHSYGRNNIPNDLGYYNSMIVIMDLEKIIWYFKDTYLCQMS